MPAVRPPAREDRHIVALPHTPVHQPQLLRDNGHLEPPQVQGALDEPVRISEELRRPPRQRDHVRPHQRLGAQAHHVAEYLVRQYDLPAVILHDHSRLEAGDERLQAGGRRAKRLLRPDTLGDVGLDPDKVRQRARGVSERGNAQVVPERRPIPLVIKDDAAKGTGFLQCRLNLMDDQRVGLLPLEEPTVTPKGLMRWVARDGLERGVGVDDGVVGLERVADEQGAPERFQR